jgi:pyruvate formate lyase activating enzyme
MIREAMLYRTLEIEDVICNLCSHRCELKPGVFGKCGVRQNRKGKLYTYVYGEVIAAHVDPIEKKPLYHFLPGTSSFSVATVGCNFRCPFCQNWQISQGVKKGDMMDSGQPFWPKDIVKAAQEHDCRSISYTYTEPTIYFEYAFETARIAHEKGLVNVFVTNGYMTREALYTIKPYLDACNVDLKSFREDFYKDICRAELKPVLDTIRYLKELYIWVEVTTLVVPNKNDTEEELGEIACFIAGVDPDIPWHISRFHPDYKYTDSLPTPIETLHRAYEAGKDAGLRYIYIGNVLTESEDTICPHCGKTLIRRQGFAIYDNKIIKSKCSYCGESIAGVF